MRPLNRSAVVLFALGLLVIGFYVPFHLRPQSELPLYLRAAERLQAGEPIYRLNERAFTYPPLFALPFVPFTWLPTGVHRPLWYLLNLAVLTLIVWRIRRLLSVVRAQATPCGPREWVFWSLVVMLAGRHVFAPLENQSHDLVIVLCVVLAIDATARSGEVLCGFWAALGTALKATPLLFAPVLLWQRRWRSAGAMLTALVALSLLPDVLMPAQDGSSWLRCWYDTFLRGIRPGESAASRVAWDPWGLLNQSLAGTFHRLFVPLPTTGWTCVGTQADVCLFPLGTTLSKWLTLAGQSAIGVWLLGISSRRWLTGLSKEQRAFLILGQGAVLATAMPLLSPTSIKTHFAVLLLPAAFCAADFLYHRRTWINGVALALTLGLSTLTAKWLLGKKTGEVVLTGGSVTWTSLALLLAAGWVVIDRSRQWRGQSLTISSAPSAACPPLPDGSSDCATRPASCWPTPPVGPPRLPAA